MCPSGSQSSHLDGRSSARPPAGDVRPPADNLPRGIVSFLFTDIESSTALLNADPMAYRAAVARHHELLAQAVQAAHGAVFETVGDAVYAAFERPTDAVCAALAGQLALHGENWPADCTIRVRMGLHVGDVELRGAHYFGVPLVRCARLMATAWGGQVVLSESIASLVQDALPPQTSLRSLGEHRLKDLARPEHVFQLVHSELPAEFPPLRSLNALDDGFIYNVPPTTTPLFGRDAEIRMIRERIAQKEVRLLTLWGAAGTGKTRLALAAVEELGDVFEHGMLFVDLSPVRDPGLVIPTVARALNVREDSSQDLVESVIRRLSDRAVLLVLDNFEHVLAAASTVARLLAGCPGVKVLITSREPLCLTSEHEFAVNPLAVPERQNLRDISTVARSPSVALFVARARAVVADFELTAANAAPIAQICIGLDGLPLAIELAAARIRVLTPEAILQRLTRRLDFLSDGGRRDQPERQQTLRAALDWSFQLLPPDDRAMFRRTGVFVGGWTVEAAAAVCLDANPDDLRALSMLERLVGRSLLRFQTQTDGEPRFGVFEFIREYALEQLKDCGELDLVRERHAQYLLKIALEAEDALEGRQDATQQVRRLDQLEREQGNIRAALRWAIDVGEIELALRLASAIWRFWEMRGLPAEGLQWLVDALEASSTAVTPSAVRARALTAAGGLARARADLQLATTYHERSAELFREIGDVRGLALALRGIGVVARDRGDYATAIEANEESLRLSRELGDQPQVGVLLNNLATILDDQGEHLQARSLCEESLSIFRALGDEMKVAVLLGNIGETLEALGAPDEAAAYYHESLRKALDVGYKPGIVRARVHLARISIDRDEYEAAYAMCAESLSLILELGTLRGLADCLELVSEIACSRKQFELTAQLLAAAEAFRSRGSATAPVEPVFRGRREKLLRALKRELRGATYTQAYASGASLSVQDAVAAALDLGAPAESQLSPREREVAILVAGGLSNRDVANKLVIVERTVETHLEHIYAKLRIRSRAELAQWVVAHQVAPKA